MTMTPQEMQRDHFDLDVDLSVDLGLDVDLDLSVDLSVNLDIVFPADVVITFPPEHDLDVDLTDMECDA